MKLQRYEHNPILRANLDKKWESGAVFNCGAALSEDGRVYLLYRAIPLDIYNGVLQFVLTFLVPVGFMSYYPATLFLNRTGDTLFSPAFAYLTPLVGLVLFAIAYSFWRVGINRYQSTGS